MHGTSTAANDKNESNVYNMQLAHLGRSKGNAMPVIAQKHLTGHPKGGAAAWMFNGLAQCINEALIPGNRVRSPIFFLRPQPSLTRRLVRTPTTLDPSFKHSSSSSTTPNPFSWTGSRLVCSRRSVSVKSAARRSSSTRSTCSDLLSPRHMPPTSSRTLSASDRQADSTKSSQEGLELIRVLQSYRKFNDFLTKHALVDVKDAPPYVPDVEGTMLLNPVARAAKDSTGSYSFSKKPDEFPAAATVSPQTVAAAAAVARQYGSAPGVHGVGTDVELISSVPTSDVFLARNFTDAELAYCRNAPDFAASLAGKWTAKEAVFKSLKTSSRGGGAAMKEIEIVSGEEGPRVVLSGEAKKVAAAKGVSSFELSISVRCSGLGLVIHR